MIGVYKSRSRRYGDNADHRFSMTNGRTPLRGSAGEAGGISDEIGNLVGPAE
jgi:hypothetical protein